MYWRVRILKDVLASSSTTVHLTSAKMRSCVYLAGMPCGHYPHGIFEKTNAWHSSFMAIYGYAG